MADRDRIVVRKQDGSGAGVVFHTQKEADAFMKAQEGYAVESAEVGTANQKAADEQVAREAAEKAVAKAEDKAINAPNRNRV